MSYSPETYTQKKKKIEVGLDLSNSATKCDF